MYWPLLNMYSENFGFGPGGFFIRGTILIRRRDYVCAYIFTDVPNAGPSRGLDGLAGARRLDWILRLGAAGAQAQ